MIEYSAGGVELLPRIEPMWNSLNAHHRVGSLYWQDFFAAFTFQERMAKMEDTGGQTQIIIAQNRGEDAGYVMATLQGAVGEVASLYVKPEHRRAGIAGRMMEMAKEWLIGAGAARIFLAVAEGNEGVFPFYQRHGFYPRSTRLELKETETERSGQT